MNVRMSPLVRMAGEARRPTRWWVAWLVAVVIIVVGGVAGQLVGEAVLGSPDKDAAAYQYVELFLFGFTLMALVGWVVLKERRGVSSLGFRGPRPVVKVLAGVGIGAGLMSLGVLVAVVLGQYDTDASVHSTTGTSALLSLLPLAVLFLLQGSTEEAVTRGYMLQMGARQLPGGVAIVASSAVFAVVHVDFHPLVLLNIGLFAVFASLVALEQGSLWMVCGLHAGWNYFQGNVYGLPVSGHAEATSLFTFGPASGSASVLTGADFGLEASLIGTAILAASTVAAWARFRHKSTADAETPVGLPT